MSRYDLCSCGGPKRATSRRCALCREREEAAPAQDEPGAWLKELADGIAREKSDTGGPFAVRFPWPLGEAQERLVRALGVTPVYERDVQALDELLEEVAA